MNRNIKLKEIVLSEEEYDNIEKKLEEYEKWKNSLDAVILRKTEFSNSFKYSEQFLNKDEAIIEIKEYYDSKTKSLNQTISLCNAANYALEIKLEKIQSKWWYKLFSK